MSLLGHYHWSRVTPDVYSVTPLVSRVCVVVSPENVEADVVTRGHMFLILEQDVRDVVVWRNSHRMVRSDDAKLYSMLVFEAIFSEGVVIPLNYWLFELTCLYTK
jgi:hypothetical protein